MDKVYDLIIVGCGPASIQLALRLEELIKKSSKKIEYIIIEKNSVAGSFFNTYPIHKKLISNNKLYTGKSRETEYSERFDWNSLLMDDNEIQTRDYTTDFYPKRNIIPKMLGDIVEKFKIPINFNEDVLELRKDENLFHILTKKGEYKSKFAVVATGFKPKKPDIIGFELATSYEKMCEKSYYRDKSVFIIGKGNSGLECANDIINEANMIICGSPSSIQFAYQTHYVGNPRLINSVCIENYQLKSLSSMLDCDILEIKKDSKGYIVRVKYIHAKDEIEDIRVDEVIYATGFIPNLFKISPVVSMMNKVWPNIDGEFMSKDIDNLYFAGALTHGLDYKQYSSSGFIHGFRYNSIVLAENLFTKILGISTNKAIINISLKDYIFDLLNNNSGIYLQPGFLGIHISIDDKSKTDCGYCSLIAFKDKFKQVDSSITDILVTLEYGDIIKYKNNPLAIERDPGVPDASVHLHPIIRIYNSDGYKEIILEENLFNQFDNSIINVELLERLERDFIK
ncbi:MAG: NAD(P)-binding domain-containing protein [Oscillospiraceae bacterium]|nr:NAD(P)-binding domain-containing protein [Oscillospiraceae bacterium]